MFPFSATTLNNSIHSTSTAWNNPNTGYDLSGSSSFVFLYVTYHLQRCIIRKIIIVFADTLTIIHYFVANHARGLSEGIPVTQLAFVIVLFLFSGGCPSANDYTSLHRYVTINLSCPLYKNKYLRLRFLSYRGNPATRLIKAILSHIP